MIKNWFVAKKNELEVKAMFYTTIIKFVNEQDELIIMAKKIYESFKGMTGDEIRDAVLEKMAELIHAQAIKEESDDK